MNIATSIKRGIVAGAIVAVAGLALLVSQSANANTSVSGPRDCEGTSVIYCGALSTEELNRKYTANATGDLPAIYNSFGISSTDVASLNSKVEIGEVHANGTVWAKGQLIGVNARTAGRAKTTNSVAIPGANAYKRPPSDSFASSNTTIKVFIGYHGDNPSWGVITSCGNPLTWDTPEVDIQKTIAKKGSSNFVENVSLKDGEKATVRIQVKETTGKAYLHDVKVRDSLPVGMSYVPDSVKIDGKSAPYASDKSIWLQRIEKGAMKTITFDVVANLVGKECGTNNMTNTAYVTATMQPEDSDTAKATVSKDCEPVYSCKALTIGAITDPIRPGDVINFALESGEVEHTTITSYVFKVNGEVVQDNASSTLAYTVPADGDYKVTGQIATTAGITPESANCTKTFTSELFITGVCNALTGPMELKTGVEGAYVTSATATNIEIVDYIFTVNGTEVQTGTNDTLLFTPETAGEYDIAVEVVFANGNKGSSDTCQTTVTVTETPQPEYRCEVLTISPATVKVDEQVTFSITIFVANGAEFQDAEFDFGDGESNTITINSDNSGSLTTFHEYTASGEYDVKVTANFVVEGGVVSVEEENCAGVVKVEEEPVDPCPYPGKEDLAIDDENCFEPCPYPGLEDIKKSDSECKPPVLAEVTPELPNTGAGSVAGVMAAVTVLGAYGHRVLTLRKQ